MELLKQLKTSKYIFFDCMETIIDLYELPTSKDYAYWAFSGFGVEHYWTNFNDFINQYETAKVNIASSLQTHQVLDLMTQPRCSLSLSSFFGVQRGNKICRLLNET